MKFNLNIKQFMKLKAAQVFNFDAQVVTWLLSVGLQPSSMTWSWLKRLAIGCHKQSYIQVVNNVFEAWVTEERHNDNNMLCDKIATNKSNEIWQDFNPKIFTFELFNNEYSRLYFGNEFCGSCCEWGWWQNKVLGATHHDFCFAEVS